MRGYQFRQFLKIFLGVCLMIASVCLLFYNLWLSGVPYDFPLGLLNLLLCILGLLLIVYAANRLPKERK